MYHLHVTSARFRTETPRSFHLIKKNKYSKAAPDETAVIQTLIQNGICGSRLVIMHVLDHWELHTDVFYRVLHGNFPGRASK